MDLKIAHTAALQICNDLNQQINGTVDALGEDKKLDILIGAIAAVSFHIGTLQNLIQRNEVMDAESMVKMIEKYVQEGLNHSLLHEMNIVEEHDCSPSDGPIKEAFPEKPIQ